MGEIKHFHEKAVIPFKHSQNILALFPEVPSSACRGASKDRILW